MPFKCPACKTKHLCYQRMWLILEAIRKGARKLSGWKAQGRESSVAGKLRGGPGDRSVRYKLQNRAEAMAIKKAA
jgi:hypothetical protein